MSILAPIALFAYRRADHLARTLDTLRANPAARQSELFVFCDAAKGAKDAADVEAVRRIVSQVKGFAAVRIVMRDRNFGLARNITEGVTQILEGYEQVIVLEDDLELSAHFLQFMNDALAKYRDEPRVGNITGYCYPASVALPTTFLVRGPQSWSWATWRDRWKHYNPDGRDLRRKLAARSGEREFDFDGSMGYVRMLEEQIDGKNDSWAIRWYATCFLRDLLTLYPGRSLVRNIGRDGSGTHGADPDDIYDVAVCEEAINVETIPVVENQTGRDAFRSFFEVLTRTYSVKQPIWRRIARRLKRMGLAATSTLRDQPGSTR
jgi:Glycosyl transferase family 2